MAKSAIHIFLVLMFHVGISYSWVPIIPPECEQTTVCDIGNIPNYPTGYKINQTIWKYKMAGYITDLDEEAYEPPPTLGPNDTELCKSYPRKMIVGSARDVRTNEWRGVLNDPASPVQTLTVEVCVNETSECDQKIKGKQDNNDSKYNIMTFRRGYGGRCVQKFFRKALLGFDKSGDVIWFQTNVPMCCACVAKMLPPSSASAGFYH